MDFSVVRLAMHMQERITGKLLAYMEWSQLFGDSNNGKDKD